jgi:hypothetical protein
MTMPHAVKTRKEIRQIIGDICGTCLTGTCSAAGSDTTVIDTQGLRGGVDDYKGQEIIMVSGDNEGEKSRVVDYNPQSFRLTVSPAFSNATAEGDEYELHKTFTVTRLNNAINLAIIGAMDEVFATKVDESLVKLQDINLYTIPSDFIALYLIEYEQSTSIDHLIHNCDDAWDELVDADVTASADTSYKKEGAACLKLVVAAGCGAGDILATDSITSLDISDCNEVVFWVHSTVALDAGDIQLLLDNSASCASPLESLDLPAIVANTDTRVALTLANPQTDTAIVSVGLKMIVDKGAFTLYADNIRGQNSNSRTYGELIPEEWQVIQGSTPKIHFSGTIGADKLIKLHGYKLISELSADTSEAEVDPDYIIARAVSDLLSADPKEINRVKYFTGMSESKKISARTSLENNTRWVSR